MLISVLMTEMVILHNMFLLLLLWIGSSITLGVCNCYKKENYNGNFCPLADIHLFLHFFSYMYSTMIMLGTSSLVRDTPQKIVILSKCFLGKNVTFQNLSFKFLPSLLFSAILARVGPMIVETATVQMCLIYNNDY